ncbi:gliding motility-associated ABC transporter ATP-binding subunit GldA [Pararhodonellum marinum]|uniref:gliding motility-associated ABC transporter ATP-binding subunit GldA n=1 Tax=Pararhodonellum marinum TaxID=2755358 RepID=UPI00188FCB39|nr:gliding motility-associated ABC transporter ATP-binding subunit GldA [Pararhodonellum marinum]
MSLEVSSLTKKYQQQKALDQVSFEALPGQVLGFLGPNGAGKSTTMKIATGYLLPDEGDVLVHGISVLQKPNEVSKLVGYLPEHNPLYLDMYVKEFLEFIGGLYGLKGKYLKKRVELLIDQCGISLEKKKKLAQLSKGYRQRVGLAKALIHDPKVIILDEPTTGLDPNQLVEIRKLIRQVSINKTLILSTHIMQEVEAICDQVVIINKGKIVAKDSLIQLKKAVGNSILLMETEENLEKAWFDLQGVEHAVLIAPNQVEIQTKDPQRVRKLLLGIVQEKSLNLQRIQQIEKNLEHIFQQLTQA